MNGHLSSEIVIGEATLATEYSFRNVLRFILLMTVNVKKRKKKKKKNPKLKHLEEEEFSIKGQEVLRTILICFTY